MAIPICTQVLGPSQPQARRTRLRSPRNCPPWARAFEEEGLAGVQLYGLHEGVVGLGEGHAAPALVSYAHRHEVYVFAGGLSIREALRELGYSDEEINKLLDVDRLTRPGFPVEET